MRGAFWGLGVDDLGFWGLGVDDLGFWENLNKIELVYRGIPRDTIQEHKRDGGGGLGLVAACTEPNDVTTPIGL